MISLNIFDFLVLFIIALSGVLSMLRGMTREFLGLAGWVLAVFVALSSASIIEAWLVEFFDADEVSPIISWGLPFAGFVLAWFIFSGMISSPLQRLGLGGLDRWLGILFGIARGGVFAMILYAMLTLSYGKESELPGGVKNGYMAPLLSNLIGVMKDSDIWPETMQIMLERIQLNHHQYQLDEQWNDAVENTTEGTTKLLSDEQETW